MGYYNRKSLLINTLNQFNNLYKDYKLEVVIANDKSNDNNKLDDIIKDYNFKIILLDIIEKNWVNPCVAYNLAIRHISSDVEIVIIQNPEIYHLTNILNTALEKTVEGQYLSFSVFSTESEELSNLFITNPEEKINDILKNKKIKNIGRWYNHPIFRPCAFHFLNSIHINDLKKIGGFDNNYKDGIWYDDNEILERIKSICNINIINPDIENNIILGIHQFHPTMTNNIISKKINLTKFNKLKSDMKKNKNYNIYCDPYLDFKYEIKNNNIN